MASADGVAKSDQSSQPARPTNVREEPKLEAADPPNTAAGAVGTNATEDATDNPSRLNSFPGALSRLSLSDQAASVGPHINPTPSSDNNPKTEQMNSPREGGAAPPANAAAEASHALHVIQSSVDPNLRSGTNGDLSQRHEQNHKASKAGDHGTIATTVVASDVGNKMRESDEQVDEEEEEDEEEDEEDSSEISASDEDGSWIAWFCSLRGNEFFCEVDEDYIQDDFNLTGLNSLVPYYDYALDMVLDVELPIEDSLTEEQQEIVESAAEMLYGLIHARYIVTNRGMHAMYDKYRNGSFGRCPHVFCQGQPVLPVGLSDLPRNYTVNVFCPRCHGLFFPKSTRQANIDGAYFGTTFPHLYLMTHPDMIPAKPSQLYEPRVYGFKVHPSSLYYRNHEEPPQHLEGGRPRRSKNRQGGGRK